MKNFVSLFTCMLIFICSMGVIITSCTNENPNIEFSKPNAVTEAEIAELTVDSVTNATSSDTSKIYTGSRGGQYVWKKSKKTGKLYKKYLPKSK
ncbi:MAG TPA: hypothetical protein PKD00_00600 [Burkholderiales bacterium]|nr:hypothetical protein [Burkholderiales bacterium]